MQTDILFEVFYLLFFRYQMDDVLRAFLYALAAGNAVVSVHNGNSVDYADCVEITYCRTVSQSDTTELALSVSAEIGLCSLTGHQALIFCNLSGCVAGTVTSYSCYLLLAGTGISAQQFCNLLCTCSSTNGTCRTALIFVCNYCICIVITTCKSASTAVCTRQNRSYLCDTLIYFYVECFGCNGQKKCCDETGNYNNNDWC